jgi:hypothetical protein
MERVAFLVERTGTRLGCLLNPESLEVTRAAGLRRRKGATGMLSGAGLSDDPFLYTGGGRTEMTLDLLFDVQVAGSTIRTSDVRDLTKPLWDLAESSDPSATGAQPPVVRFLWGKSWNVPGVVTAVAERLEQFSVEGLPGRSWLRMRLARVSESEADAPEPPRIAPSAPGVEGTADPPVVHQVLGGGADAQSSGERLEDIAFLYYGDPSAWRLIADANAIIDGSRAQAGALLTIPPPPTAKGGL